MKTKDLPKLIPAKVRITKDISYEVLWVDSFPKDSMQVGECRQGPQQIVLRKGSPPTETFKTYLHELYHSISFENDINLTEAQVTKLEEATFRVLKLNGILDSIKIGN